MEYDEDDPARDQRVVHGDEDEEDIPLEDDEDDDEDGEAPKGTKRRGGKKKPGKHEEARIPQPSIKATIPQKMVLPRHAIWIRYWDKPRWLW